MLFALFMVDKPGMVEARMSLRPEHVAYVMAVKDRITISGPLLSDDGKQIGSLLVMDWPSKADAEKWVDEDPWGKAGIYATRQIYPFSKSLPKD